MASVSVVLIDKYGKVSDSKVKEFKELELYKKAGFKTSDGFESRQSWKDVKVNKKIYNDITIYSKIKGNAGKENKYDLPPPIDKSLFFGTMVIVYYDENRVPMSLKKSEWKAIYETLMGGFESLDEEEEASEDEILDKSKLDKYGYEKDGFIAEDDDCEEELEYDSELSEEEYFG
uniref:Uncharacterized protein n=1 Tax=viral metagenome TaxID=1070528 RepID=A0A6C0CMK1_9ZZZZ